MRKSLFFFCIIGVAIVVLANPLPIPQRTTEEERVRLGEDIRFFALALGFLCGGLAIAPYLTVASAALLQPHMSLFIIGWALGAPFGMGIGVGLNIDTFRNMIADGFEHDFDRVAFFMAIGADKILSTADGLDGAARGLKAEAAEMEDRAQGDKIVAPLAEGRIGLSVLTEQTADWLRRVAALVDGGSRSATDAGSAVAEALDADDAPSNAYDR